MALVHVKTQRLIFVVATTVDESRSPKALRPQRKTRVSSGRSPRDPQSRSPAVDGPTLCGEGVGNPLTRDVR